MCSRLNPRKSRNKKTAGGWYEGLSKMDALTSKKGTVTAADMIAVYRYGLQVQVQVDNLVLVEATHCTNRRHTGTCRKTPGPACG